MGGEAATFDVFGKGWGAEREGDRDTNSGDTARRGAEGGGDMGAADGEGDWCIVSESATRWQQRAACSSVPVERERLGEGQPCAKGCARKGRVDKYGAI